MSSLLLYTAHRLLGNGSVIIIEARQFGSQVLNTVYHGGVAGKVLYASGVSEAALMDCIAALTAEINSEKK